MDDNKIIDLYFSRDENAISETADTYGKKLSGLSFSILRNDQDADEAVNDTYLKVWNTIPPQRPTYFYAFISKICRHICFGILDYQKAKKRNFATVSLSEELENCIPDSLANVEIPDETLGDILTDFLNTLSADNRRIFLRRYWYCNTVSEIASRYHLSESKVKTSLYRVRNKLKAYLETEGIDI